MGFKGQEFQDLQGFKGQMVSRVPKVQGFQVFKGDREISSCWPWLSKSATFQNPRAYGVKYIKYKLDSKISSYVHSETLLRSVHFMENWTDWTLHSTAKIFSSTGINYSIIRSYYTSDYWQPGALVSFFNYIPGLLYPKKIMWSQSGSITFRRVRFCLLYTSPSPRD